MKIQELLAEAKNFSQNAKDSIPNASSAGVSPGNGGPTNFYWKYRAGLAASFSPGEQENFSPGGPAHDDMIMVGYSKADQDIINKAHKLMGWKRKKMSNQGSKETEGTHTVSPVSNWNNKK